jgi:hypothetical protein
VADLEDAEFSIPDHIVADIAVTTQTEVNQDGSVSVGLDALTISQ